MPKTGPNKGKLEDVKRERLGRSDQWAWSWAGALPLGTVSGDCGQNLSHAHSHSSSSLSHPVAGSATLGAAMTALLSDATAPWL
jgi:hypothetical protein